jgi:hypothetical protein
MPQPTLKTLPFAQPTQCHRYEGRVAIVTGAAQGLGLVIARRLAEEEQMLSFATSKRTGSSARLTSYSRVLIGGSFR